MPFRRLASATALLLAVAGLLTAQTPRATLDSVIRSERYVAPPDPIVSAVLAPRHQNITLAELSPDGQRFLHEPGDGPVTMDRFSKPFHELGGLFIDFRANRNRTLTIRSNVGIELISATTGALVPIQIPPSARVSGAAWSPDGRSVAFFVHGDDATHIWIADAATGRARQLTRVPVLATLTTSFEWSPDSRRIAAIFPPTDRGPMPVPPAVPQGPRVKLAEEHDRNRLRTYASLMATPYDQALLEWHANGQLAFIDVATRAMTPVGRPAMITAFSESPNLAHLLVTRMTRPFSYLVPVSSFGTVQEIWDRSGKSLALVLEEPLNLGVDSARTPNAPGVGGGEGNLKRREIAWRQDGRGLSFLEQEPVRPADTTKTDDGQPRPKRKDRLYQWQAPFDSAALKMIVENDTRMSAVRYAPDHQTIFATERTGQSVHEFAVALADPGKKLTLARYRNDDIDANPGALILARGEMPASPAFDGDVPGPRRPAQVAALSPDGKSVYYYGTQYDKSPYEVGPKSFIDRTEIATGARHRTYLSENGGIYERVLAWHDLDAGVLTVSRESATDVPQSYRRSGAQLAQLTHNQDFTPDLTRAPRESFTVERPDGFKFRVNVTLPPGYQAGTRLPAMFWFYPREFAGQEEYDKGARTFNRNAFPSFGPRSIQYLIRLGYAVVEPDVPIVGPTGLWNNNYENDLRNNLAAVIDEADRRGLIDRTRLGIGGHSYGAFSTVNAMAHTPFFKAGIAGDGNYNRTLTPLNFQNERRDLWEARSTYLDMSPILYANNLTGALLMYHGLGDQNVGTEPSNSPRLFHALNGLGKVTSLYLYPFEDHGPATRETLLDLWARWTAWLGKYLDARPAPGKPVS